ncbi:MAG: hypothetical protein OXG23_09910 [Chloroflexi bacterium]|nr:hypothetical protein [Chloroflexota bacterium]
MMLADGGGALNQSTRKNLAQYDQCISSIELKIAELPPGPLADSYHLALTFALAELSRDRAAIQALFASAMADEAGFDLLRGERAERLTRAYHRLALTSDDAFRDPAALELAIALYAFHMLAILFWLYDRSPEQASTRKLLNLTRELFKLLRPLFFLPMLPQGIAKLAEIVLPELRRASEGAAAHKDPRDGKHEDFDIHRD